MRPALGLELTRVSGTENTFFIVNGFDRKTAELFDGLELSKKISTIRWICNEIPGFQTDGFLVLRSSPSADFRWDFWNSDGSFAEMCGNAARCATLFFDREIASKGKIRFETGAGIIHGQVVDKEQVEVEMTEVKEICPSHILSSGEKVFYTNTGVPHVVLESAVDLALAQRIRNDQTLLPSGTNVTFVSSVQKASCEAVTFERGVEGLTKACGTGAVAAALYLQNKNGPTVSTEVRMPGGLLTVREASLNRKPSLLGPAQIEFKLMV